MQKFNISRNWAQNAKYRPSMDFIDWAYIAITWAQLSKIQIKVHNLNGKNINIFLNVNIPFKSGISLMAQPSGRRPSSPST